MTIDPHSVQGRLQPIPIPRPSDAAPKMERSRSKAGAPPPANLEERLPTSSKGGWDQLKRNFRSLFVEIPKFFYNACFEGEGKTKVLSPPDVAFVALTSLIALPTLLMLSPVLIGTALVDAAVAAIHPEGKGIAEMSMPKTRADARKKQINSSPDSKH